MSIRPTEPRRVVDMFSGLGGSSKAATIALARRGERIDLRAINHWNLSVASHFANHPEAAHFCERITLDRAREIVPEGWVDLLIASPECTNHSRAKAGQPRDDQSRASPFLVADWCSRIRVERLFIENVQEMRYWGPLDRNGRPIPELAGTYYRAWLNTLRAMGYELTEMVVDAADLGDPQHRERLFIMAKLGGPAPRFPRATHGPAGSGLLPYVTARQIVDWSDVGDPVEEKRRLTTRTRQVIARGLEEFGGEPFLIPRMRHNNNPVRSIDRPLMTVTCTSWDIGLVTPRNGRVHHRSLRTNELKRAMGLPEDYRVLGQSEARPLLEQLGLPTDCSLRSVPSIRSDSEFRTVQIGNAVCVGAVAACIEALMAT